MTDPMEIPDEAARRFPTDTGRWAFDQANKDLRQAFISGAEWARKEAEAEREGQHTISEFHGDNVWRDEQGTMWMRKAELDAALKALSEARARYGDVEQRLVEAEAVIEKVSDAARENAADGEWFYSTWHVDRALALHPPVVLADHDKEVAARAWDRGYTSGHSRAMRRMSDEPNVESAVNPYRVADQNGDE